MDYSDYSVYDTSLLISGLLTMGEMAKAKFEALPEEEKERILKERANYEEQKRVNWFIQQGKCPYCGEKLIRGKKHKKNGYKRVWECLNCDEVLKIEGKG